MFRKKNVLGHLYQDGEVIIKQGSTGQCLYVIQQGKVEVVKENKNSSTTIAVLGEKEFFGEMALFEKDVRSATVKAKGEAKVLTLNKKGLYKTIQTDPSLAFRLLEKMSNRLRKTNKQIKMEADV